MQRGTAYVALWCLLLLAASSCRKHTHFYAYRPIDTHGWHRQDTVLFSVSSLQHAGGNPQVTLGIRHKDSYRYRDIWLVVNGDTVHLQLAGTDGNWNGSGIGGRRQYTYTLPAANLPADTATEWKIYHIMHDNPLEGITDIGLQIHR